MTTVSQMEAPKTHVAKSQAAPCVIVWAARVVAATLMMSALAMMTASRGAVTQGRVVASALPMGASQRMTVPEGVVNDLVQSIPDVSMVEAQKMTAAQSLPAPWMPVCSAPVTSLKMTTKTRLMQWVPVMTSALSQVLSRWNVESAAHSRYRPYRTVRTSRLLVRSFA